MRYSRQRELILKKVNAMHNHPTAEEIYEAAGKESPGLSLGTVYRNLNVLADAGMIRRVSIPGKADRFDHTLQQHSHRYCTVCGGVDDISLNDAAIMEIVKRGDDTAQDYSLVVFGTCEQCRKKAGM